jgi:hypothetical protein
VQLTERDRILLTFAAEHRFVTAGHVSVGLEATEAAADARLRALSSAGYLRRERKIQGEPAGHRITAAGLRAIGSELPAPRTLDLATYRHDEALAWLMLAARRGRFGPVQDVISERRMRSHDAKTQARGARYGVRLGGIGPGGRERLHYPDLVLVTGSGHRVAFELELSSKARDRRERILAGYGADRRIDAVVYLVDRAGVREAIRRSAARVGISDIVRIQTVALGGAERSAGGGRTADRAHHRGGRTAAAGGRSPETAR